MRGNAGEGVLLSSFAGITLIRFCGYDLSLALSCRSALRQAQGQTPRELYRTKLRKKSLKVCNIYAVPFVLQQIQPL